MLSRPFLYFSVLIYVSLVVIAGYALGSDEAKVARVFDGDTILLENGERVRYIGIDTPEKGHPYYFEARQENAKLVEGKRVRLEYDVQKQDKYARTLAYVYVGELFVNAELVKNGYALVYTLPPNVKYAKDFLLMQREARKAGRGLWGLGSEELATVKDAHKNKCVESARSFWDYLRYKFKQVFK